MHFLRSRYIKRMVLAEQDRVTRKEASLRPGQCLQSQQDSMPKPGPSVIAVGRWFDLLAAVTLLAARVWREKSLEQRSRFGFRTGTYE